MKSIFIFIIFIFPTFSRVLNKDYYSGALPGKIFDYYDVAKGNIPSALNFAEKVPETFFEDEEPVKLEEPENVIY